MEELSVRIGYARTLKYDPEELLERQLQELRDDGCEHIYSERTMQGDPRPALEAAIGHCQSGDTLVLHTIGAAAKSAIDLPRFLKSLASRKVRLRVLFFDGQLIETDTDPHSPIFHYAAGIYELEMDAARERHLSGVARAREQGRYRGRSRTARDQSAAILDLVNTKQYSASEAAKALGISRASVYRVLQDQRADHQWKIETKSKSEPANKPESYATPKARKR